MKGAGQPSATEGVQWLRLILEPHVPTVSLCNIIISKFLHIFDDQYDAKVTMVHRLLLLFVL